jgi:type IV pilus assembly protein PilA
LVGTAIAKVVAGQKFCLCSQQERNMKSMKMMKKAQSGFTLIELMIVIAIIGILAAIAIPQYQDYVTRAKYQDGMVSLDSTKTATALCIQNSAGDPTQCNSDASIGQIMPTTAAGGNITIARGASWTAGTGGIGGTAIFTVVGNASMGSCTVTATGTVGSSNLVWTNVTSGTNCSKSKTGY